MFCRHAFALLVLLAVVQAQSICAQSASLGLLATGTLSLNPLDSYNNAASKDYMSDLSSGQFQPVDVLGYAFALTGMQFDCGQPYYTLAIDVVEFQNQNTRMRIVVNFRAGNYLTQWTAASFSYLVVSRNFDGAYSNIWASTAEVSLTTSLIDFPADSKEQLWVEGKGTNRDCEMFRDPSMKVDLAGCQATSALGQFTGGLPIIHAYIMGFRWNSNIRGERLLAVSLVSTAAGDGIYNDAQWSITYQGGDRNGPRLNIDSFGGALEWVKIGFVYSRMDYYAPNYPQGSQLRYSSSYLFEKVPKINGVVPLRNSGLDGSLHYFPLRHPRYAIFGFSSLSLAKTFPDCQQILLKLVLDAPFAYTVTSSLPTPGLILSADLFASNADTLCPSVIDEIGSISQKSYFTVPTQSQYQYIVEDAVFGPTLGYTNSRTPLFLVFASQYTGSNDTIRYRADITYSSLSSRMPLKMELRYYEVASSMVPGNVYSLIVKAQQAVIYQTTFTALTGFPNIAPTINRGFNAPSNGRVRITILVTYARSTLNRLQSMSVLLALYSYTQVYDPSSDCCLLTCPQKTGLDVAVNPAACVHCESFRGLVYNTGNGSCTCLPGYYLDPSTEQCFGCSAFFCAICSPTAPTQCTTCTEGGQLDQATLTCSCSLGYFVNNTYCQRCPSRCSSCSSPSAICLNCSDFLNRDLSLNCACKDGFYDIGNANCSRCASTCLTCVGEGRCSSCDSRIFRVFNQGICSCMKGFYQFYSDSVNNTCVRCNPECQTCNGSPFGCTSCDPRRNRVMGLDSFGHVTCLCQPGFYGTSDGSCIQSNCRADPFCSQCESGLQLCVQCQAAKHRILQLPEAICRCADGYYEHTNSSCISCPSACLTCKNALKCTACVVLAKRLPNGLCSCPNKTYFSVINDGPRQCVDCPKFCETCINGYNCTSCSTNFTLIEGDCLCSAGHYLQNNSCLPCGTGCKVCINSTNCSICSTPLLLQEYHCLTECSEGYARSSTLCVSCPEGCLRCSFNLICFFCATNRYSYRGKCYQICPAGTIEDKTNTWTCTPCNSPCQTCQGHPSICTSCQVGQGYLQSGAQAATCVQKCVEGTYALDGACRVCDFSCATCLGEATRCLSCPSGRILYRGSCWQTCPAISLINSTACVDECPQGYFKVSVSECAPCSIECLTCEQSANNCTACLQGFAQANGSCTNKCNSNQLSFRGFCVDCAKNCHGCVNTPYECIQCSSGFVRSGSVCQSHCQSYEYLNTTINACQRCDPTCSTCIQPTECITCRNGNIPVKGRCPDCSYPCLHCSFSNGSRCTSCIDGFLLYRESCFLTCPNGTKQLNSVCVCVSGLTLMNKCVSECGSGYFNSNGTCLSCQGNCLQCQDKADQCINCQVGFSLDTNHKTCLPTSTCPYGQEKLGLAGCRRICGANFNYLGGVCTYGRCISGYIPNGFGGCIRNTREDISRICPRKQLISGGICVDNCGMGTFADHDLGFCSPCLDNCLTCTSASRCLICSPNYTLKDGSCIVTSSIQCKEKTFLYRDSCLQSCPIGTSQISGICERFCPPNTFFYRSICFQFCPTLWRTDEACVDVCPSENVCRSTS